MALLTVPDESAYLTFAVTTSDDTFDVTFSLFEKADLRVSVDAVELTQADFTFSGTLLEGGGYDGGTVTLNTPAVDETVIIWRDVAPARTANYAPANSISPRAIDLAFNRSMMIDQDLKQQLERLEEGGLSGVDISEVAGLQAALDDVDAALALKASSTHTHLFSEMTDAPSQTGNSGKYLSTNGAGTLSWGTPAGGGGGGGDMLKSDNLSGLSNYTTARTNMGLTIGTHVQAYNAILADLAGLIQLSNKGFYFDSASTATTFTLSATALTLLDDSSTGAMLTTLGAAASATTISAGGGLTGGGSLASNRTITLDVNAMSAETAVAGGSDYFMMYDASESTHDKVLARYVNPETLIVCMSDETTALTTGAAKVTMRAPYAMTITAIKASLTTASSSGIPTIDINESGTTILSTKLTIDASETTSSSAATPVVISDTVISSNNILTFDIDVAGTGAKGLKVYIDHYRT